MRNILYQSIPNAIGGAVVLIGVGLFNSISISKDFEITYVKNDDAVFINSSGAIYLATQKVKKLQPEDDQDICITTFQIKNTGKLGLKDFSIIVRNLDADKNSTMYGAYVQPLDPNALDAKISRHGSDYEMKFEKLKSGETRKIWTAFDCGKSLKIESEASNGDDIKVIERSSGFYSSTPVYYAIFITMVATMVATIVAAYFVRRRNR